MKNGLAGDESNGDGKEGLAFSFVSGSPHCIHLLIVSIDIYVPNHSVTRTMSLASRAPDALCYQTPLLS